MSVFRAYDIRGIVDEDFDVIRVERLGRACGRYFLDRGLSSAVVGRDCRFSSPAYHDALALGMSRAGLDVISVGMVPTPVLYFAVKHLNRAAGIMVTASHNPPQYNGFKIWAGQTTIHGGEIQKIHALYTADAPLPPTTPGLISTVDILPAYTEAILSRVHLPAHRPLRVVVDGGNGVGGELCVSILKALSPDVDVIPLFCEPDGAFPNHHPDPVIEDNMRLMRDRVLAEKADLGIGLDGDADRLGLMDEAGRLLCGDELLSLYARDVLTRCPGGLIMGDVKCSNRLFDDIRTHGGEPLMWCTGHSLVKAKMLETGAPLAGEMSGHMFFNEGWFGFDDAIYGAARFLALFSAQSAPLSALPGWPLAFTTREINLPCDDDRKFATVDAVKAYFKALYPVIEVDGARVSFPHGWGLVRASNTQPVLVTRYEADSPQALAGIQAELEAVIAKCSGERLLFGN